jgi:hypothetical protein
MTTSKFDSWLTKEPVFNPTEVSNNDWINDQNNGDNYAPFDETHCSNCNVIIGAYLDYDPETTADIYAFKSLWIMDEDCEKLFCEDCYIEVTEEIV